MEAQPRYHCDSRTCPGHVVDGESCSSGWFRCNHPKCAGRHGTRKDAEENACSDGAFKCEMLGCSGHPTPGTRCKGMFL